MRDSSQQQEFARRMQVLLRDTNAVVCESYWNPHNIDERLFYFERVTMWCSVTYFCVIGLNFVEENEATLTGSEPKIKKQRINIYFQ